MLIVQLIFSNEKIKHVAFFKFLPYPSFILAS
jgi:hypothetical protein